jgi:hypothetical protein
MKKKLGSPRNIMIVLGIVCIAGLYLYLDKSGVETGSKVSVEEAEDEIEKSFNKDSSEKELVMYEDMSEAAIIQEVHNMTHQKVHAPKKWGKSEITEDKVNSLYELVINTSFEKSTTKKMLLQLLEPWTRGDFSNAVHAHNTIWAYQNGTIGEATRLLTPQEELDYIEKNF